MADTPRLGLPIMAENQAGKYITFNELTQMLDALLNTDIEQTGLTAPPGSPQEGQLWLVAPGATGAWAGHDLELAQWYNGAWYFFPPSVNTTFYDKAGEQRIWVDPVDQVVVPLSRNLAVLGGLPTNGALDVAGLDVEGWDEANGLGRLKNSMDPVTGTFTAPTSYTGTTLFQILVHLYGDQGNTVKEEDIYLDAVIAGGGPNAGTFELANLTVSTDKTTGRVLGINFTKALNDGETLRWRLRASANLGTFTFQASTFQIMQVL